MAADVVETEHRLEKENTAAVAEKDAFTTIISDSLNIDAGQQVHKHLQTIGLSSHIQTAAATGRLCRTTDTERTKVHFRHMAVDCIGVLQEQGELAHERFMPPQLFCKLLVNKTTCSQPGHNRTAVEYIGYHASLSLNMKNTAPTKQSPAQR